MFRGINSATLDSKGRVALPTRVRESLDAVSDGKLVVTIDTRDRCLLLYPLPLWEEVHKRLDALSNMNPNSRIVQRLIIGYATDLEPDANGRLLLPAQLREYAGLDKRLNLVGQTNKIEIWSEERWEQEREKWLSDESVAQLAQSEDLVGLSV